MGRPSYLKSKSVRGSSQDPRHIKEFLKKYYDDYIDPPSLDYILPEFDGAVLLDEGFQGDEDD